MMETTNNHRNLEMRKIESLKFLYEVNSNGTIFRNVKSKKQLKIKLDYHHSELGYYTVFVRINKKTIRVPIHKVVAECWLGKRPPGYEIEHIDRNPHNNDYRNLRYVTHSERITKPVILSYEDKRLYFESMTKAAYFIAEEYNRNIETIRKKLKQRRKKIYDYQITYHIAETGHDNFTE